MGRNLTSPSTRLANAAGSRGPVCGRRGQRQRRLLLPAPVTSSGSEGRTPGDATTDTAGRHRGRHLRIRGRRSARRRVDRSPRLSSPARRAARSVVGVRGGRRCTQTERDTLEADPTPGRGRHRHGRRYYQGSQSRAKAGPCRGDHRRVDTLAHTTAGAARHRRPAAHGGGVEPPPAWAKVIEIPADKAEEAPPVSSRLRQ